MSEMKNWTEWKTDVESFLDNGDVEDWMVASVSKMLAKGENDVTRQTKFSGAIKSILEDVQGAPIGRSPAITGVAATTLFDATDAIKVFATVFDMNPALKGLLLPHGRSAEVVFENGDAFVTFLTEQMKRNAVKSFKAGWDGEATSLVSFITEDN